MQSQIIVVIICLAAVYQGSAAEDESYDAQCEKKLNACAVRLGWQYGWTMSWDKFDDAVDLFCHDTILIEEAKAVMCMIDALESRECMRSLKYAMTGDAVDELSDLTQTRVEEALEYMCDNSDALVRIGECLKKGFDTTADQQCTRALIKDLTPDTEDAVCEGVTNAIYCYINQKVFPHCYEADLNVLRNLISDFMPDRCVQLSVAHHVTGSAAAILAGLVLALWFTQK